jgi:signal transduction histidine kinase
VTLFLLTALLVWSAWSAERKNRLVAHTYNVLQAGSEVEAAILTARTADKLGVGSMELINAASRSMTESLSRLFHLTPDNPPQQMRVRHMMEAADRLTRKLEVDESAGVPPAVAVYLLEIDSLLRIFRQEEQRLLSTRRTSEREADEWFWKVCTIVIALNVTIGFAAYRASIGREMDRRSAQAEIQVLNDRLNQKIVESEQLNAALEVRVTTKTRELEEAVEKLERSNAELERFAFIASHDLQEPLRQVANFNGLLALKYSQHLDQTGRGYVDNSIEGVKRLQAMMRGLLAYSLITPSEVRPQPTRVEPLIRSVLAEMGPQITEAGATFTVAVDNAAVLAVDGILFKQLVLALITNSLKFRRPDVPLDVSITVNREGNEWRLDVLDNGIGIEPRFSSQIFEIFGRLHPVGRYSGVGVGLAISKKIVEYHGGTLSVNPAPGGAGSCFRATLPVFPPLGS